ncbi:hypothetical protein SISNIDRAFT_552663 [Sistotremastrum niveocremeum HHB9708]|uniref:Uncharacterized protein n=1 Tax=Sistotremastrum niveocremeum HHB9708 TaxID=1314777 RepID=A0A164P6Q9_9AGAM|nr:hypothetical protein SISNIDRAFT_552663 [Sistotremastrum niveocremeum HHB9708]
MATAAVTYNLSPSALQKYLSIEDLPRIPEHQWPRQEAKLTRLGTSDCVNIPYEVSIPSTEFVNDPTNTHRNLPEFTEERSRMLHGLISSVLTATLGSGRSPHKKIQETLHKKGLVLINWPYGIRPFFEKRAAELTGTEMARLIKAFLHPNPASRIQLVSRHHFSRDTQPGYISYISSFHEDPRQRQIIDEDYNETLIIPSEPIIVTPPLGRCRCHLSSCRPVDLSGWINFDNKVVIPNSIQEPEPVQTSKRTSDHLEPVDNEEKRRRTVDRVMPKTRLASGSMPLKTWASDGSCRILPKSQPTNSDDSGSSHSSSSEISDRSPNTTLVDGIAGSSKQPIDTIEPTQSVIDLTTQPTPSQQISYAMIAIRAIRDPNVNIDLVGKERMVWTILDGLECIPSTPTFPPATENAWSDIVELASSHILDSDWLPDRLMRWFCHILEICTVSIEDIVVTIRAVRKLLHVTNVPLKQKVIDEVERLIIQWWVNLVPSGTSRSVYNRAWCLLGELSDLREVTFQDEDTIQLCWKKAFRLGIEQSKDRDQTAP